MSLKQLFDNIQLELVKRKYYNANRVDSLLAELRTAAVAVEEESSRLSQELSGLMDKKSQIGEALMKAQSVHDEIVDKARGEAGILAAEADRKAQAILEEALSAAEAIKARAQAEADEILRAAEKKLDEAESIRAEMSRSRQAHQDYAVAKAESAFSMLRRQHQQAIEQLNLHWQDFLCGLYEDEAAADAPSEIKADDGAAAVSPEAAPAGAITAEAAENFVFSSQAVTESPADTGAQGETVQSEAQPAADAPADLGDKVNAIAKELSALENEG